MTDFDPGQQLRDRADDAGWDVTDLWIASVAIGGNLDLGQVNAIAAGATSPTRGQYVVLAAALNEHFADVGQDHRVPTWEGRPQRTAKGSLSN